MAKTFSIQAMTVHPSMAVSFAWEAAEASAQTFLAGALLVSSGGYVQEAGADPVSVVGIALRAGQNGGSNGAKKSHFTPMLPGLLIEANLSQAAASTVFAQATHMWGVFGVVKRSSGTTHWVIDSSDTAAANIRVRIVGFAQDAADGDTDARVIAAVLGTVGNVTNIARTSAWA